MKKRIVFNLKREWYDKIASGEKTVEYRRVCDHWMKRLGFVRTFAVQSDWTEREIEPHQVNKHAEMLVVFRLGYSRKYPDIVCRITNIDIGPCPYDGWNGNYFRIYFEKGTSDITPFDLVKQPDEIMREDRRAEHSEEI